MQCMRCTVSKAGGVFTKKPAAYDVGPGRNDFGAQLFATPDRSSVFPVVFEAPQWNSQCHDFVWEVVDDVSRLAIEAACEPPAPGGKQLIQFLS